MNAIAVPYSPMFSSYDFCLMPTMMPRFVGSGASTPCLQSKAESSHVVKIKHFPKIFGNMTLKDKSILPQNV
jgi:hypothetical protein